MSFSHLIHAVCHGIILNAVFLPCFVFTFASRFSFQYFFGLRNDSGYLYICRKNACYYIISYYMDLLVCLVFLVYSLDTIAKIDVAQTNGKQENKKGA